MVFGHRKNGIFKGLDKVGNGIRAQLSDKGFKLGEQMLDGVEVGRVGGR